MIYQFGYQLCKNGKDVIKDLELQKIEEMANIFSPLPDDKKAKTLIGSSPVVLHVSKKILARQSIFRNIDCNITDQIKRGPSFLTEEQIKMSSIYEKLVQRIQKTKLKEEDEIREHHKAMQRMASEIKFLKSSLQEDKVEMWEAKNQIMELQEMLQEEMEEYNALCQELRAEEEEDENYEEEEQNEFQNQQSGVEDSENGSSEYEVETSKSLEQVSKPSCSIKYFISNRTITSPGLSKQNLQVGSGINFYSEKDENVNEQRLEREQPTTEHNLLSFKKSEKLFSTENQ